MVASVRVEFGGIELRGSYKDSDFGDGAQDQTVYHFDVKYAAGDMTFGGSVGMSTTLTEADGTKTETEQTNASVKMTYKIGPGIKVDGDFE